MDGQYMLTYFNNLLAQPYEYVIYCFFCLRRRIGFLIYSIDKMRSSTDSHEPIRLCCPYNNMMNYFLKWVHIYPVPSPSQGLLDLLERELNMNFAKVDFPFWRTLPDIFTLHLSPVLTITDLLHPLIFFLLPIFAILLLQSRGSPVS